MSSTRRNKIALKIVALACALLMIVSGLTPCIAVDNSTDTISNADGANAALKSLLSGYYNPGNWDFSVGDPTCQPTNEAAEQIGKGLLVDSPLVENNYTILVVNDCTSCFGDNSGGIYFSITPIDLPVASFTCTPENPVVDEEITFDAASSYDPDDEIVSYNWDFGDGNSTEGKVVTNAYSKAGNHTATLTVTDNDGLQNSTELSIEVKPMPVLLIHGLLSNPGTWNTMKDRLEREGYIVDSWDYAPGPETATGNINIYAKRLKNHIESDYKDVEKLDIVAHSMGGLIARAYLKHENGNTKIRKFIMIGTPNNGSELCRLKGGTLHEFLKHFPEESPIKKLADMAEVEPAFEQLTPGNPFLKNLNHDFTHLANTEVHTIAGTDDTWNDYAYSFNLPWLDTITIRFGRMYQQLVEPLLMGPDDSVVRVDSVGNVGITPREYHAAHTWRNPELEHDGIINEVVTILCSEPQNYSQDRIIGAASAGSTTMSIQYVFTDSNTLSLGEEKNYTIPVSFTDAVSFLVGWDYGTLNVTLTTPSGDSINSTTNTTTITYFFYYNETTGGIQGFNITNPEVGDWEIDLVAQSAPELNYSTISVSFFS